MFAEFLKESKVAVRCITYLIFLIALAAMFFSQYWEDVNHDLNLARQGILFEESRWGGTREVLLVKPDPNAASYGSINAEVPEQVMRNVTYRLFRDISNNQYDTYLFGVFAVHEELNPENQQKVLAIFEKITGESPDEVDAAFYRMDLAKVMETRNMDRVQARDFLETDYYKKLSDEFTPNNTMTLLNDYEEYMPVKEDLSYDEFKKLIGEVKHIIGGKAAAYEDLSDYGSVPLTYDEASARYETFVNEDNVSGAYARLFCNDIGFVLGILPALIAAEAAMGGIWRRKSGRVNTLLYEPDRNQIWIRFLSMTAMIFIPVMILAITATFELAAGVKSLGLSIGYFAFIVYSVAWLLPTVMFTAAAGLFMILLTKRLAGILAPLVLWLWSIRYWGDNGLENIKYGANLFLRHNMVGEYQTYLSSLGGIILNRAGYTILALILIAVLWLMQVEPDLKPAKRYKL
jgi:ABC-2 type transport system permease protein